MVVGIVCDDPLFRESLECLVGNQEGFDVQTGDGGTRSSIGQFAKQTPDVLIAVEEDLSEEEWVMLSALKTLTAVRIIGIARTETAKREMTVDAALLRDEGSAGLFKVLSELRGGEVAAVAEARVAYGQKVRLTPRETQVAELVAQGHPNRRIGQVMGLQEQSVKNLVSVVMRKLNCENRVQVALKLTGVIKESSPTG